MLTRRLGTVLLVAPFALVAFFASPPEERCAKGPSSARHARRPSSFDRECRKRTSITC